jgi:hypothetical protein
MLEGAAQSAVSIMEANKTLDMVLGLVRDLIGTLARARRDIRRGINPLRSLRGLDVDDALNRWMEYRYGWRPLFMDIESHIEAIQKILEAKEDYHKVTAVSDVKDTVTLHDGQLGSMTAYYLQELYCSVNGKILAFPRRAGGKAGFFYKVEPHPTANIAHWLGFGSIPSLIWELVPYSFVLDWFGNFGDFVSNLGYVPSYITDIHGYISRSSTWTVKLIPEEYVFNTSAPSTHPYLTSQFSSSGVTWNVYNFSRSHLSPVMDSTLVVDINLSIAKLVDAIALARNLATSVEATWRRARR